MTKEEIILNLKDDNKYYGRFGQQFLSNSKIQDLLKDNPYEFLEQGSETMPMVKGRYFHVAMLEPHKLGDFDVVDASTRNTKVYREASNGRIKLLKHERDDLDFLIDKMKSNEEISSLIYSDDARYEVPGLVDLFGNKWKGKADVETNDYLFDLKTTSDINNFERSVYKYNYDSQAYIYSTMFSKPLVFIVIDSNKGSSYNVNKSYGAMGIFTCSDEMLESGRNKVLKASKVYDKFFGPNKTEDQSTFLIKKTL